MLVSTLSLCLSLSLLCVFVISVCLVELGAEWRGSGEVYIANGMRELERDGKREGTNVAQCGAKVCASQTHLYIGT